MDDLPWEPVTRLTEILDFRAWPAIAAGLQCPHGERAVRRWLPDELAGFEACLSAPAWGDWVRRAVAGFDCPCGETWRAFTPGGNRKYPHGLSVRQLLPASEIA